MNIGFAGCSFTYGSELKDPENTRWSKLICNQLNANEFNFAKAGSSNEEIFKNTFEQSTNQKFDFFVVQITSYIRFSLVLNKKIISISPTQKPFGLEHNEYNLIAKLAFSNYQETDNNVWHELTRWKLLCLHHYLNNINMNHMFVFMSDMERLKIMNDTLTPNSFKELCCNISLLEYTSHCGLPVGPNRHPLEKGHEGIANDIILPKMKELL